MIQIKASYIQNCRISISALMVRSILASAFMLRSLLSRFFTAIGMLINGEQVSWRRQNRSRTCLGGWIIIGYPRTGQASRTEISTPLMVMEGKNISDVLQFLRILVITRRCLKTSIYPVTLTSRHTGLPAEWCQGLNGVMASQPKRRCLLTVRLLSYPQY